MVYKFDDDFQWDNELAEEEDYNSLENKYPKGRSIIEFPADLTREEFVTFNKDVSKFSGRQRHKGRFNTAILIIFAITVLMIIYDFLVNATVDYIFLFFLIFWIFSAFLTRLVMPNAARRSAEKLYDKTILSGHSYFGIIHIFNDHIEKISESNEVSLSFRDNVFYFENEATIGVMIPGKPAIIIPARCITHEDLAIIKRALLPAIPLSKQYISKELIPLATRHISNPLEVSEESWDYDDVYRVSVAYTKEELRTYNGNIIFMNFVKRIFVYAFLTFSLAVVVSLNVDVFAGILSFVGGLLAILLIQAIIGTLRVRSLYSRMEESGDFMTFEISPVGIIIKGTWAEENINGVTWEAVKRAVNGDKFIDFYTDSGFLSIPKRCILDFERFEEIVNKHYVKPSSSSSK